MPVATGRHYVICAVACRGLPCKGQVSMTTNEEPSAKHAAPMASTRPEESV